MVEPNEPQGMSTVFRPEPLQDLRARFEAALATRWQAENINEANWPGRLPEHVFDCPDGIRLTVFQVARFFEPGRLYITGMVQEDTAAARVLRRRRPLTREFIRDLIADRVCLLAGFRFPLEMGTISPKGLVHLKGPSIDLYQSLKNQEARTRRKSMEHDRIQAALQAVQALREDDVHNEYRTFDRSEWKKEVAANNTNLGYWEWVEHQIEGSEHDEIAFCTCTPQCPPACKGQECGCQACHQAWADDQSVDY